MIINPDIVLDPSEVHDYRHIRPAVDSGMRMVSYQFADFVGSVVGWMLVVVLLAAAAVMVYGAVRPRHSERVRIPEGRRGHGQGR